MNDTFQWLKAPFAERQVGLHRMVYAAILGPIPDSVEIKPDGFPNRPDSASDAIYAHHARVIWQYLHQREGRMAYTVERFLNGTETRGTLKEAVETWMAGL